MRRWKWEIVLALLASVLVLAEMATAEAPSEASLSSSRRSVTHQVGHESAATYAAYYEDGEVEEIPIPDLEDWLNAVPGDIPSADTSSRDPEPYQGGSAHDSFEDAACCCVEACCACGDEHGDAWRLFPHKLGCGIKVGGWIDNGATTHDGNSASKFNGPVTFNDREEYQLNQVYLYLDKPIDNGGCGWGFGGRVDLLYGTDHRFTTARGLETNPDLTRRWNSRPFYGLAMPQAYVEAAYNNLSVKMGHFYTIVGYETVPAPENFFYSHAYTMQYGEPFTHSGLLASWSLSDALTFQGGFDRGWDNWEAAPGNNRLAYLGGASWDNGCGTSVAISGTLGREPTLDSNIFEDQFLYSLVISRQISDRLTYVIQHDRGWQDQRVGPDDDAEWYGINQYFLYQLNCKWSAGARVEWFRDDDGSRVTALQPGNPISDQFAGNFWEVTLGLNYRPASNLLLRPEFRYDWYNGQPAPESGNLPFDDGRETKLFTAAMDLIWTY